MAAPIPLLRASIPAALQHALQLHQGGHGLAAIALYQAILDIAPERLYRTMWRHWCATASPTH